MGLPLNDVDCDHEIPEEIRLWAIETLTGGIMTAKGAVACDMPWDFAAVVAEDFELRVTLKLLPRGLGREEFLRLFFKSVCARAIELADNAGLRMQRKEPYTGGGT